MHFGESVGRFSGLMPPNKPSVREAAQAKATLLAIAMHTINPRFDPTLTSGRGGSARRGKFPVIRIQTRQTRSLHFTLRT